MNTKNNKHLEAFKNAVVSVVSSEGSKRAGTSWKTSYR